MFFDMEVTLFDTIGFIVIMFGFISLFTLFIRDKYPIQVSTKPLYIGLVSFLILVNSYYAIYFITSDSFSYLEIYLFMLSILSFFLMFFIFKI